MTAYFAKLCKEVVIDYKKTNEKVYILKGYGKMHIIIPKIPEKTITLPTKAELLKGLALVLLMRAQLPGMSPLGIALAATFPLKSAYIALFGLCTGVSTAGISVIKYILSYFIYYILEQIKKPKDTAVSAIAVGVAVLAGGALNFLWTGAGISDLLFLLAEMFVAGGVFYLFSSLGRKNEMSQLAAIILTGGILNGIAGVYLPYININAAVFFALLIAMSLCYACEPPLAVMACTIIGFIMNITSANALSAAGVFAISAMLSSCLAGMGKAGVAVGFLCGITVGALQTGSVSGAGDIFAALAVFVMLPETVHFKISSFIGRQFESEYDEPSVTGRVANQLKTVAKAVCDLAEGVNLIADHRQEGAALTEMFDTVSDRVCSGCSLEESCWRKDRRRTYGNMYELWNTMETDGFCDYTNVPSSLRQLCIRCEGLLCEFKHMYEMYKQNALYRGEALSGRDIMARQYSEISNVIQLLSHEVETGGAENSSEPRYRAEVIVRQEPKDGNAVCGDTVIHFGIGSRYFVILCDGMGAGDAARSESRLTARLFAEFLKAGFEKETAVNMINSALALKADQESFSTVDLLEINLENGTAEFLKIGSAQSFLKTKGNIEVISSKALPVGILESIEVSSEEREIKTGDMILMVSDGIGEAGSGVLKNDWIKKLLMMEKRSDEELLNLLVCGAKSRVRHDDDMTGVIVRIKRQ